MLLSVASWLGGAEETAGQTDGCCALGDGSSLSAFAASSFKYDPSVLLLDCGSAGQDIATWCFQG